MACESGRSHCEDRQANASAPISDSGCSILVRRMIIPFVEQTAFGNG